MPLFICSGSPFSHWNCTFAAKNGCGSLLIVIVVHPQAEIRAPGGSGWILMIGTVACYGARDFRVGFARLVALSCAG